MDALNANILWTQSVFQTMNYKHLFVLRTTRHRHRHFNIVNGMSTFNGVYIPPTRDVHSIGRPFYFKIKSGK